MGRNTFISLIGLVIIGGQSIAHGQAASRPQQDQRWMQRADKDGDGKLSEAERQELRRRMQGSRAQSRPAQGQAQGQPKPPPGTRVLKDVEYARADGKPLRLDIYLPPKADKSRPLPVVVWVHGGGWQAGSKNNCPIVPMCGQGYAVVSVQYRLTDVAVFPAQVHDCKGAIRWIRANAAKYGFDPDRIGAAGASAGGHLVALLGTSGGLKELEGDVGGNLDESSRVQAVVDFCGPAAFFDDDAPLTEDPQGAGPKAVAKLLGGPLSKNHEKARLASPVAHASKDDPPFLIVHGDEDPLVSPAQSRRLAQTLDKAGVPVKLHIVKGAGHRVTLPETLRMAGEFFDRQLKDKKVSNGRPGHHSREPVWSSGSGRLGQSNMSQSRQRLDGGDVQVGTERPPLSVGERNEHAVLE